MGIEETKFNPFAYQTPPIQVGGVQTPQAQPAQGSQPSEAVVKREQPKPQAYATTDPIDKNFIQKTFAYVPFTNSPVSDTNYDDSDYRGRGAYFVC